MTERRQPLGRPNKDKKLTCLIATVSPVTLSIPLYTTPKLPPGAPELAMRSTTAHELRITDETHGLVPLAPDSGAQGPRHRPFLAKPKRY